MFHVKSLTIKAKLLYRKASEHPSMRSDRTLGKLAEKSFRSDSSEWRGWNIPSADYTIKHRETSNTTVKTSGLYSSISIKEENMYSY